MKKVNLFLAMIIALAMPAFAATISVDRMKPAEIDLGDAKTIAFLPVEAYQKKGKSYYGAEQASLGNVYINGLKEYVKKDGRFQLIEGSADIYIKVTFNSFSVTDDGMTITQEVDGETVTIKDNWTRSCSCKVQMDVIRVKDNKILGSRNYQYMEGSFDKPKAQLAGVEELLKPKFEAIDYDSATLFLNTPYWQPVTIMDTKSKDKAVKEQFKNALKMIKKEKKYEEAKAIYSEIYESTGELAAGFNLAMMLEETRNFDSAEAVLNTLLEQDPKNKTIKKALEYLAKDRTEVETINSRK